MMHRFHPRTGKDSETLLFDDCDGCRAHVNHMGLNLDQLAYQAMWKRMVEVEINNEGRYRSNAESDLAKMMYRIYVALERYTTINPEDMPWR